MMEGSVLHDKKKTQREKAKSLVKEVKELSERFSEKMIKYRMMTPQARPPSEDTA